MDNVASLIYCCLDKEKILKENQPGASLTILANKCSGQNKNNTVLKLTLLLVERGYFKEVTVLSFIHGHTKNACNWMFNIKKKKYHESNTSAFSQIKERLIIEGQVESVDPTPETFHGWGKVLKISNFTILGTIFKNHIFSCNLSAPTILRRKEWRDVADTNQKKSCVMNGTARSDCAKLMKQYKFEQLVEQGL
jgi:hypothetical protein